MTIVKRRCLTCETRAMGDDLPRDAWEVIAPSGLRHLTEGSGYTFCGKNCAPWEHLPVNTERNA